MTAAEFASWRTASVASYAAHTAAASGRPVEETAPRAAADFDRLLAEGLETPRTWLLRVLDGAGTDVGVLWLGPQPDRDDALYVFDVAIDPEHRGRGLGRAAMTAAEQIARSAGMCEIGLQVFGFNDTARRLYDSLGYRVVATRMTKTLADRPAPEG